VGARRLGQDEQYLTVREILSEASTLADGALSRERSDFYRFGHATLGYNHAPLSKASQVRIKKFGQDDLKKQQEKGGMFSSNVDRSTYIGTLPSRKSQKTDKVDISFYRYCTDVNNLILRRFLEEKVWT
jgi:hypothetical protein